MFFAIKKGLINNYSSPSLQGKNAESLPHRLFYRAEMKIMRLITTLNILLLFCICTNASADIILDTGATPGLAGYSLHSGQWLAAEFSIDKDMVITDVEGWLNGDFNSIGKTFTTAIYTIGSTGPGLEIYSAQVSMDGSAQGWSGPTGMSWHLEAASYWATFEVREGDNLEGFLMPWEAPYPANNYAYYNPDRGWRLNPGLDTGVLIQGTIAPVPEPATIFLFGIGLAGLAGSRLGKLSVTLNKYLENSKVNFHLTG